MPVRNTDRTKAGHALDAFHHFLAVVAPANLRYRKIRSCLRSLMYHRQSTHL
ncbi:MAG TPA: hypothetical protein VGH38_19870 [Bryobacteraceae bacterium]